MRKKVFVYLFEGFSDWEIGFVTPELRKSDGFELVYFSGSGEAVVSMGGLCVSPDMALSDVKPEEVDLLILPGGGAWEKNGNTEIDTLVNVLNNAGKSVAAICGATLCLGRLGLLDGIKHTSNALFYLKQFLPDYNGEKFYSEELAVRDCNIITASGIGAMEFAKEIFTLTDLMSAEEIDKWFMLFKFGVWKG